MPLYSTLRRERSMDKRFSWIFLAVSAAFFIFIVGLTGYRIENARRHNASRVAESASALAEKASALGGSPGGYAAPEFARAMRAAFDVESRLLLLCVRTEGGGIEYLVSRNRSYLKAPETIDAEWRGVPAYRVGRGYEVLVNRTVGTGPTEASLDALFVIMGREDLSGILRDDLYLFLSFLLLSGVFLLIITSVPLERPRHAPPAAARMTPTPAPERSPFSPRSGLVWTEHLEPRMRAELERAGAGDHDISLARIRIDASPDGPSAAYRGIAAVIKETFPSHDLIFESGADSFSVLLVDCDIDAAVRSLESLRKRVADSPIAGKSRTLSIGVSARGGRLLDGKTLYDEAEVSLAKAGREGGDKVIGFRADPAKYRAALSGQRA
jgi:hypothetical protein